MLFPDTLLLSPRPLLVLSAVATPGLVLPQDPCTCSPHPLSPTVAWCLILLLKLLLKGLLSEKDFDRRSTCSSSTHSVVLEACFPLWICLLWCSSAALSASRLALSFLLLEPNAQYSRHSINVCRRNFSLENKGTPRDGLVRAHLDIPCFAFI